MNRRKLMQHLKQHGCVVLREGRRHTVVFNTLKDLQAVVERHGEINARTVQGICKHLDVPPPTEK